MKKTEINLITYRREKKNHWDNIQGCEKLDNGHNVNTFHEHSKVLRATSLKLPDH